ncbi:LytR/AlgR family response regulator transcription factor [Branchiibius hedensis]|uniref:LytR/AlgR family response regulator transcription factor n=1 Tax=Branchiibius hedensis TaxID=672460 RepID=UPI001FE5B140|nr:LytTR family DNA-binding domain-containing protein [Branchiibius hedensis]
MSPVPPVTPPEPLRVLVVDDEAPARDELVHLLAADDRIGRVHVAPSGSEALRTLEAEEIDVVFSDVSMPGLDGMDLTRVIARFAQRPQVVLVTAHQQYAVDAFALQVADYLMKPVRAERLAEAVRRVSGSRTLPDSDGSAADEETIAVERGGVTRFIRRDDIRYVHAQGDYARLHTDSGTHLVRIPLATLEQRWEAAGFIRIHRSILVATKFVGQVRMRDGHCTVVVDGEELSVSRRHTRALRDRLLRQPG